MASKPRCISLTASRSRCLKLYFSRSGLRPTTTDLGGGTVMHCWVPRNPNPTRRNVLLIHGFGANALWQFCDAVPGLVARFNVYVPDLLFFGKSYSAESDRSEGFQARCVKRVMEANKVEKMAVVGLSYGGFVAYSMASQFPESVEKVVICCAGVCLEEKDLTEGLFMVSTVDEAAGLLMPKTVENLRELMRLTFYKFPKSIPSFILEDFIEEMCVQYVQEKSELLHAIARGRKLSELPKISQPTLIMWGDKDQVFPMELAHRLERHLGENAELAVIKKAGHGFFLEKPRQFNRRLKAFLEATTTAPAALKA